MLQIKEIRKQYITGDLVQTALDGVSLNLRDNEFVAILGPSGSGKTTLLNVIGGLDRYDSGDLIINGISTKKYTDRDWDSYRNHTIGFVFQSYNLIPHQSVLANVELALTISGISRSERRKRAAKALKDVGLGDQLHKRPNQMSGGQMQRVAIARALVNNPDILLADEPTGALDSETSVQVMELLKEVSRDRLVVMVTHNPELAEAYANRIVRVKDGRIIDDTNPFFLDAELTPAARHENMGKASMSFWTALTLSFNNLSTKKARTLLTAFAGSIGIIGIALIMALSTGFQKYIDKIQADTLSNYPLTIQSETADMTSAFAAFGASMAKASDAEEGILIEQQMITQMFAQIGTNDIGAFKAYLEENYDQVANAVSSIKYGYGVRPRIFLEDTSESIIQVNPGTLFAKLMGNSPMAAYMMPDIFQELVENSELLESQYDVLRGRWPEKYNEMVVVLSGPNQLSDYLAYTLGLKDQSIVSDLMKQVMEGKEPESTEEPMEWTYDDLMDMKFRLVNVTDMYRYNGQYNVWEDMSSDNVHMKDIISKGEPLEIVGIICPREGASATALTEGVAYRWDLTHHVMQLAADSPIVKQQLEDENTNVFTGEPFGEESNSDMSFEDMISVDSGAIQSAFGMNISTDSILSMLRGYLQETMKSLQVDLEPAEKAFVSGFSSMSKEMLREYIQQNADESGAAKIELTDVQPMVQNYLSGSSAQKKMSAMEAKYAVPADAFRQVYQPLMTAMVTEYVANQIGGGTSSSASAVTEETTATAPVQPTETQPAEPQETNPVPSEPQQTEPSVTEPVETQPPATEPEENFPEEGQPEESQPEETQPDSPDEPEDPDIGVDPDALSGIIRATDVDGIVGKFAKSNAVEGVAGVMAAKMMETSVRNTLMNKVSEFGGRLSQFIGSAFTVDGNKLASAFQFNMTEEELMRLMQAMAGRTADASAKVNLQNLGYAELEDPTYMYIYMVDFAAKETFMAFLDGYNEEMLACDKEDYVIRYTDVTGIMMASVRTIIDSVSYALIAFVAVSLVVSSIMIGIITYISVMERTKEIGVLRAIGASKRNITQVFNAETFIIGLFSGVLGIGITLLILIPGNQLILHLTSNPDIVAQLPVLNAAALIALSVVLTLIGGIIPAKQAAKKDPVIALRSE